MINSVRKRFLDRIVRIVEVAIGLGSVGILPNTLLDDIVPQVAQGILHLMVKGACKNMLLKSTASLPFGQFNDIDARIGEKAFRLRREEQEPDVFRLQVFLGTLHDIHALTEFYEVHRIGFRVQRASHLAKISLDERDVQVVNFRSMVHAIIERDIIGEVVQVASLSLGWRQSARHFAYPINPLALFPHAFRGGVGAHASAGRPNDDEGFALVLSNVHNGHVVGLDKLALVDHILEPQINFIRRHPHYRSIACSILANANDEIPSTPVVNIIGERANSLERCLRIPRLLEFDARTFHNSPFDQGFYTCRKSHGISSSLSYCCRMIV